MVDLGDSDLGYPNSKELPPGWCSQLFASELEIQLNKKTKHVEFDCPKVRANPPEV